MIKKFSRTNRHHDAFTLVELLVVIAIIGVLVGLLLPAVQAAREAARRMQCSNNMKQIGLAVHMYHDSFTAIPPASFAKASTDPSSLPASWLVRILPYMEQSAAYERAVFAGSDWGNRGNGINQSWQGFHKLIVETINCPSSPLPMTRTETARPGTVALGAPDQLETQISSYAGISGEYGYGYSTGTSAWWNGYFGMADYSGCILPVDSKNSRPLRFASVMDGLSNTFAVGEQANFKLVRNADGTTSQYDHRSSNFYGGAWCGGGGDADPKALYGYRQNYASVRRGINFSPTAANNPWGTGQNGGWPGNHSIFNSAHPGGAQFLRMDGSVQFVTENINFQTLSKLVNRRDGETIEEI
ncbi:DUF1559 domain-containing protein [Novipirellula sp.]|uniref:DUF1559 family PulG-like putative transporter n=1 Tax=Novipirellula sp. TaxID=2795430 RepID=UPI0035640CF0